MITLATMYNMVSVVLTTAINVSFEAFFVMGLVYAVNLNTGVYKSLADLTTEFADFRKVFWNSLESDISKEKGNKTKELEEEIKILKIKVSKLKKLYLASNDVIEKLDERLRNIEDELDEEYDEDGSSSSSEDDNDTSSEEKNKKHKSK
jgi:hypothetical protein